MQSTADSLRVSEASAFMLEHVESAWRAGIEILENEARSQVYRRHKAFAPIAPQPCSAFHCTSTPHGNASHDASSSVGAARSLHSSEFPYFGDVVHTLLDAFIATGERVTVSLRDPMHGAARPQWDSSTHVRARGNSVSIAPPVRGAGRQRERGATMRRAEGRAKGTRLKEAKASEAKPETHRSAVVEWAREKRVQERRLAGLDGFCGRLP